MVIRFKHTQRDESDKNRGSHRLFLEYHPKISVDFFIVFLTLVFFQFPLTATASPYGTCFEKFTLYQEPPEIHTYGDNNEITTTVFDANLTKRGKKVIGQLTGTITSYLPSDNEELQEIRRRYLVFNLKKGQIIATGNSLYPLNSNQITKNSTIIIPVVGGTGKYIGASGQVSSTRNLNGTYTHRFKLLKNHQ